jgi:hypothetical protein
LRTEVRPTAEQLLARVMEVVRRECAVGTVKKSIETRSRTWLARNVRHVCEGGGRRFEISRDNGALG